MFQVCQEKEQIIICSSGLLGGMSPSYDNLIPPISLGFYLVVKDPLIAFDGSVLI